MKKKQTENRQINMSFLNSGNAGPQSERIQHNQKIIMEIGLFFQMFFTDTHKINIQMFVRSVSSQFRLLNFSLIKKNP